MDRSLNELFAELKAATPDAKRHPEEDLVHSDIPFQLLSNGGLGGMTVIPDESSDGISTGTTMPVLTTLPLPLVSTLPGNPVQAYFAHQKLHLPAMAAGTPHSLHELREFQHVIAPQLLSANLYPLYLSQPQSQFVLKRGAEGQITGFTEKIDEQAGATAKTSTDLTRRPGSIRDFARGNVAYLPFKPGGLEDGRDKDEGDEGVAESGGASNAEIGGAVNDTLVFPWLDASKTDDEMASLLLSEPPGFNLPVTYISSFPSSFPSTSSSSSSSSSASSSSSSSSQQVALLPVWSCPACTFENSLDHLMCSMCESLQPPHAQKEYQAKMLESASGSISVGQPKEAREELAGLSAAEKEEKEAGGAAAQKGGGEMDADTSADQSVVNVNPPRLLSPHADMSPEQFQEAINHVDAMKRQRQATRREAEPLLAMEDMLDYGGNEEDGLLEDEEEQVVKPISSSSSSSSTTSAFSSSSSSSSSSVPAASLDEDPLESLLGDSLPFIGGSGEGDSNGNNSTKVTEWAVMSRIDVSDFHSIVPRPAIAFPFELDTFQKEAVIHMERGENVFVAAHTSAGKTVVAEYAIALASKHFLRAVYTSPIKTLSNQKFREFRKTFGDSDVGIVTGDVSINPEAPCLILTTEILRSMLYKGADLIRDIEWVIFDEVHYINDIERGVVWEEIIIMLPATCNIVLLSATVPNTQFFANWVGRTKKQKIFVISTNKRPVPLQHYLWAHGKLFPVMDAKNNFNASGIREAKTFGDKSSKPSAGTSKPSNVMVGGGGQVAFQKQKHSSAKNNWISLVHYLKPRELLPVVVFAFSKKVCEDSSAGLYALDLSNASEKSEIHRFITSALTRLRGSDRNLPQVLRVSELLKRGIGVHHAGMLPILKEVVEMVFSKGLVKILFATETFAMGVNMPTKVVVFHSTRKHDGRDFRNLTPGEYTQMGGRAGRRGLDTVGFVIINCRNDEVPDEMELKTMLTGKPTKLESQFRLTYNMILNLLRQEDLNVVDMIKRSFGEFKDQLHVPERKKLLRKGTEQLQLMGLKNESCDSCAALYQLVVQKRTIMRSIMRFVFATPKIAHKFLTAGRVLLIRKLRYEHLLAVILRPCFDSDAASNAQGQEQCSRSYHCLFLLPPPTSDAAAKQVEAAVSSSDKDQDFAYARERASGAQYMIALVHPGDVDAVVDAKVKIDVTAILLDRRAAAIASVVQQVLDLYEQFGVRTSGQKGGGGDAMEKGEVTQFCVATSGVGANRLIQPESLPSLHPTSDLGINSLDLADSIVQLDGIAADLSRLAEKNGREGGKCVRERAHFEQLDQEHALRFKLELLRAKLSDKNLHLVADFELRLKVLQELQYIDQDQSVLLKGRCACEINTCESLIVTELVFETVLTELPPEEIVALLSCLVFQEKNDLPVGVMLPASLQEAQEKLVAIATSLANLQLKCGLDVVPLEFVRENINPGLMEVVYHWGKGVDFKDICELTDVLEGSIVRCMLRLDETCKDIRNAARVLGNPTLYQNMVKASEIVKRDIVFAASLYVV